MIEKNQKYVEYYVEIKGREQTEHAWEVCCGAGFSRYKDALRRYNRYGGCQKRIRKKTITVENKIIAIER